MKTALLSLASLMALPPMPALRRQYGPGGKNHMKGVTRRAYNAAHLDRRSPDDIGTRQVKRAAARAEAAGKAKKARKAEQERRDRELRLRQGMREKSGFYDGRPPMADRIASLKRAGRRHRRVLIDDTGKARAVNLTRLA